MGILPSGPTLVQPAELTGFSVDTDQGNLLPVKGIAHTHSTGFLYFFESAGWPKVQWSVFLPIQAFNLAGLISKQMCNVLF